MEAIMDGEIQTSRRPKSTPWNNGRITGQKRPLKPKDVWAIRIRLQLKCALNRHPLTRNRKFVDSPLEGWREMDANLQFLARGDQFVPRFVRCCFTQRPSVSSHGIRRRPPPIR